MGCSGECCFGMMYVEWYGVCNCGVFSVVETMVYYGGVWRCVCAPNDTSYLRWSCHSGHKLLCKLCRTFRPQQCGARFTIFWASRPCGPAGWLALLLTKAADVETNPCPTTLNKRVWICDICNKLIHDN